MLMMPAAGALGMEAAQRAQTWRPKREQLHHQQAQAGTLGSKASQQQQQQQQQQQNPTAVSGQQQGPHVQAYLV